MQPIRPKRGTIAQRVMDTVAKRLFGFGPVGDWSYVDKFTGPAKDQAFLNVYQGLTFACINAIAEEAGKYTPYAYKLDADGNAQTVPNHPFIQVLQHPNPDLSQYQLNEGMASFVEIFGEFFIYVVGGKLTGQPKELYLLRPDKMGIDVNTKTGDINGYYLDVGNGGKIPFEPEEIIHHMTFNPRNPYRGMGTIEAAMNYIQTEEEVSAYTKNFFHNNAGLSGVLNIEGKVSRDSWQKFVRQWRERYEGVTNAGKIALIRDTQATFTKVGLGLNEIDMSALKDMTNEQVMMMFRVPKGILGMESGEGLGRASVETLEYIFAKRTIEPKLCRFDDTFQRAIDQYYPKDQVTISHKNMVPADKEFELTYFNQAVDRWLTRDEIRDRAPELATGDINGGDDLFIPVNMIPVGDASSTEATTAPPAKSAAIKIVKKPTQVIRLSKAMQKKILPELSIEQKENFRLSLEKNANRYSRLYKKAFKKVVAEQRKTVLGNIEHLAKDISGTLIDQTQENQKFADKLRAVVSDIYMKQGEVALLFAGDTETDFTLRQSILSAIDRNTKKMANNFNGDTLAQLNAELGEGVAAGEGLEKLTTRVESVYDAAEGWRAERVARTESINASNDATREAYKQTDFVTGMQWFANPDACEFCSELDGNIVSLDDNFVASGGSVTTGDGSSYVADYGDVENPPLHPNCSCTIIPVTLQDQADAGQHSDNQAASLEPEVKIVSDPKDKETIAARDKELAENTKYTRKLEKLLGVDDEDSTED